ncbi:hypothetical protein UNDKW_1270 [Undibacterium sp. KW1]|uniref:hypothetical protein n=1 Tax=Undibacterium sp. KW1 TaxID=2058624 RepID=UPI001331DB7E|nr:hypothetical protein [Undibacterium sp. KW1]BBB59543.1 hypothetical protein UNDKW_1270 [Undibacterium sp. KW1]
MQFVALIELASLAIFALSLIESYDMSEVLDVFQNLFIHRSKSSREELRQNLIDHAVFPWTHVSDEEGEEVEYGEILLMERAENGKLPGVRIGLWPTVDGYSILNIIPIKTGSINEKIYNEILQEFANLVVFPAIVDGNFSVHISKGYQSIDDWFSPTAVAAFKRFSNAANKSTGASHPLDNARWIAFLIDVHRNRQSVDSDFFFRWMVEIEGWSEEIAHHLVIQYEFAGVLLQKYDETK